MSAHIMVDLETMGTAPGSAIVSIGAVVFDPVFGTLGEEFHRVISLRSNERAGLRVDPDAVIWWMKQSEAARAILTGKAEDLPEVLGGFTAWWLKQRGRFIWGHGANFDEPLLTAALAAAGLPAPWRFWDVRCTRTIYALADVKLDRAGGVHHKALDDAKAQAVAVIRAYRNLGLVS